MFGKLYLVGSPIGNIGDVSSNLYNAVHNAKYICVEDIDRFKEFCNHYNFKYDAELIDICYSENNNRELQTKDKVISLLKNGEDVYIISDEGMPALADPGDIIVNECIKNKIDIVVTPGPSTVMAAAAIANTLNSFIFEGFIPFDENARKNRWNYLKNAQSPMIFLLQNPNNMPVDKDDKKHISYQSSNPFFFIDEAIEYLGNNRPAVLCFNLTTNRQKVVRKTLSGIKDYMVSNAPLEGNMVIVIDGMFKTIYCDETI